MLSPTPDILLIDKPTGISSFDVIRRLRREYKEKGLPVPKMGHGGTLDPLASGLMIIGVGAGTKKLNDYLKLRKEYIAEVLIGERRTTGDMEGDIVEEKSVEEIFSEDKISSTLRGMLGHLPLPVSAYSAIKKDGVPMYKRARKAAKAGKEIEELPIRVMEVIETELLAIKNLSINRKKRAILTVRFYVGSGTYIRSLGEELGKRLAPTPILSSLVINVLSIFEQTALFLNVKFLVKSFNQWKQRQYRCRGRGYPATLYSLRRTKIGEFSIENARSI